MSEARCRKPSVLRPLLSAVLTAAILQACSSGGSGSSGGSKATPLIGQNGTYLFISTPDFYFGTLDVGTVKTQKIQISNRGADVYTLKSLGIESSKEGGKDDVEQYTTDIIDEVVLNPAEAISVGVTFQPITEGRKFADFTVDYETLQQVDESVNVNEQKFYKAKDLEDSGDYQAARQSYSDYIDGDPVTVNKRKAAIKLPVISESGIYGDGEDFDLYLDALDQRESGDLENASVQLEIIHTLYSDGYLADDALYLQGYIQLMDEKDYSAALQTMQRLRNEYPDSTYYDTALYSEAMAQHELGNSAIAREILLDLRYRHTGVDTLGITLAKDNLVSRLWFDRANEALERMGTA
ncbi:tetratricopeptide repeat protein [Granulosicoccus sp. 3-233]